MSDHDKSQAPQSKRDGPRPRARPQVSIRTDAFRFEMSRLPKFPRPSRWIPALLSIAVLLVEVMLHIRHIH